MTRPLRLLLLLVPAALGLASAIAPGRAQTAPPDPTGRFAFSDTTLLRDTLNLRFGGLFPLADSLGILPDSLRALSVRYRMSLERLTFLADSLHMPVDSVGVVMRREQFNPLAAHRMDVNQLTYMTSYNIAQTTSTWTNGADWNFTHGPLFVHNTTNILMDRFKTGTEVNLRQTRSALTEGGWKLNRNLSLGGRANLERFDAKNPGNYNNEAEKKNEFQLSARSKFDPNRSSSSELSFFTGLLDVRNSLQVKRGLSAELSAKNRWSRGRWFVNDISGRASGNRAHTRVPTAIQELDTKDMSDNLDGTLALYASAPVGLNLSYGVRRVLVETPLDSSTIQQVRTDNGHLTTALRMRRDNDRYLNVSENIGRSSSASATNLSALNRRSDQSLDVSGRYRLAAWFIDASFDNNYSNTQFPQRATTRDSSGNVVATGGYGEKNSSRLFQSTMSRGFGRRFTFKADGRVSLTSSRYYVIGVYPSPPVDHDQYRQSYKLEGSYVRSLKMSTSVSLEVIRQLFINIPSASTGANNETRTYRAEWRWSFQLAPTLTVTQRNQMNADYVFYNFLPANDRLSLSYNALTTLNAILSPRTNIEITHNAQVAPGGNYRLAPDGLEYFSKADEGQNYTLRARVAFAPSALFSLSVESEYISNGRSTVTDQGEVPLRDSRSLNFSGGGTLNIPIGTQARLSGDLNRTYRADRVTAYQGGIPLPSPHSEQDYWYGRLELSWNP